MHRIFIADKDIQAGKLTCTDKNEVHHVKNVLRLKKEDAVKVFNGQGTEGEGVLTDLSSSSLSVEVARVITETQLPARKVILACAIPKNAKFEYILEKCTELGVAEIIPLQTARSNVILRSDKKDKKHERFETVVLNAVRQSKRLTMPKVHPLMKFEQALAAVKEADIKCIPWLEGTRIGIADVLKKSPSGVFVFFIGPEGDFTPEEVQMAKENGFVPVDLGNLTLKVDTAAIAVAAVCHLWK